jgi:predicted DsbA family dithiol-disulfide isomerase
LKRVAEEVGVPFGERTMTYNSRLAQELAKWAESKGKEDAFHEAVFRAYYVEAKNIGKKETLLELARCAGLDEEEARSVLESRSYRKAVDSDWARCSELDITAVPTFQMDGDRVVGAQPYEVLEQFLRRHGVKERK